MRQIRITSADIVGPSADDCQLAPDDPLYAYTQRPTLGSIESNSILSALDNSTIPQVVGSNKGTIAREQNIKPGTDEWFRLWFTKPGLTGEDPYNKDVN